MLTLVAQLIASCCMSSRMSTDFTVAVAEAMSFSLKNSVGIDLLSAEHALLCHFALSADAFGVTLQKG